MAGSLTVDIRMMALPFVVGYGHVFVILVKLL